MSCSASDHHTCLCVSTYLRGFVRAESGTGQKATQKATYVHCGRIHTAQYNNEKNQRAQLWMPKTIAAWISSLILLLRTSRRQTPLRKKVSASSRSKNGGCPRTRSSASSQPLSQASAGRWYRTISPAGLPGSTTSPGVRSSTSGQQAQATRAGTRLRGGTGTLQAATRSSIRFGLCCISAGNWSPGGR